MFSVDSMRNLKHRAITALTATVIGCSAIALAPTSAVAQTYNTNDGDSTQHGSEPNFNNSWGPSNVPDGVDPGPTEKQVEQSKTIGSVPSAPLLVSPQVQKDGYQQRKPQGLVA